MKAVHFAFFVDFLSETLQVIIVIRGFYVKMALDERLKTLKCQRVLSGVERKKKMGKVTRRQSEYNRQKILIATIECFLENGYTNTTIKQVTTKLGISTGAFTGQFRTKEDVLCELVSLDQAAKCGTTESILQDKIEDKILFFTTEEVLQLYMAETYENIRDIYKNAYSLPKTSALIQQIDTPVVENIFKEYLPEAETKDFYMLEMAGSGILRSFMAHPCEGWLTMEVKVEAFLRSTFRLYCVPEEKVEEAIAYAKAIDFQQAAEQTIEKMLHQLELSKEILQ